ncbi:MULTISPECIES: hypothetical protein [Amycolatopsis]|nr:MULTISPECIES: hypothetical protein [Amycolatopsis]OAP24189.1 hypothetical protein A4R44_04962 [Amycolatopsis sp. M39]
MTGNLDPRMQARIRLLAMVFVALAAIAAFVVIAHNRTAPVTLSGPPGAALPNPGQLPGDPETALATRPMTWLPAEAAQPHPQSPRTAGPPIVLPPPSQRAGRWIPDSFPPTAEGALAQLAALNQAGLSGGDPETYDRAYAQLALQGAPSVAEAGLHVLLREFRKAAGVAAGEITDGLTVRYEVTHGLIKGTADQGHYVVACTLGQFSVDYQGQGTSVGVGDCQALRWTGSSWRISPGPRAAYASSAWPGTDESVDAGYRALGGAR